MRDSAIDFDKELVGRTLERILSGPSFRSSPQCQALLRYIVDYSVAGKDEMLRERLIGVNVFGRSLDYDTGNDPVVRARVAEVRKRLAQFYLQRKGSSEGIRIAIPTGSYRAVLEMDPGHTLGSQIGSAVDVGQSDSSPNERLDAEDTEASPPKEDSTEVQSMTLASENHIPRLSKFHIKKVYRIKKYIVVAVLLLGATMISLRYVQIKHERAVELFWAPIIDMDKPALIFIGANHTYDLDKNFLATYRTQHNMQNVGSEFFIDLRAGDKLDETVLVPNNWLIGFGDVAATARIASQLTKMGKNYEVRYGNDITASDFHSSPAILIGGFSNIWTLEVMRQLPIRLQSRQDGDFIVDTGDKPRAWKAFSDADSFRSDDYAVITRLMNSETGNFVLVIAGIGTYGNQVASEFLSDSRSLNAYLERLPSGWERKNMQIVLHATLVKKVPISTDVETLRIW